MKPRFYITTAISYPNGVPHVGHAYEAIAADVIARFERLDGKDVFFLTGTDEHGLKMKQTALREGLKPQDLADKNASKFIEMTNVLNLSNDDFIRTTEMRHHEACKELWLRMEKNGDIYKKKYGGWYSVRDEIYYKESETDLVSGNRISRSTGTPVEWFEEETFFFRLSSFTQKLLEHYEANKDFILPLERRNEVISFVKMGLEDLSISRSTLDWGIPVPNAPGHVMYVWVDALNNYITATGLLNSANNTRKEYWPADVHVIGKDIVRFHAVYWPAFLMSANLPLPKRIFSHGFVLNKGEKMSKSVGNVVDPFNLIQAYGREQVRYFFLKEVVFGQDGNYTVEAMTNRINADLANNFGNLAQRSLSMIYKNCDGHIPQPSLFQESDRIILEQVDELYMKARTEMDKQGITKYLDHVWTAISDANLYFATEEPWAKKKTDPKRMETILYVTSELIRQFSILVLPVLPEAGGKLLDYLNQPLDKRTFEFLGSKGRIVSGTSILEPQGIFPRHVYPLEQPQQNPKSKEDNNKKVH
ncbi:MAG: methionine--tRNA ligase [Hyphomicrobium sp.]